MRGPLRLRLPILNERTINPIRIPTAGNKVHDRDVYPGRFRPQGLAERAVIGDQETGPAAAARGENDAHCRPSAVGATLGPKERPLLVKAEAEEMRVIASSPSNKSTCGKFLHAADNYQRVAVTAGRSGGGRKALS